MKAWLERRVPELVATFSRFPLALLLAAGAVAMVVGALNGSEWFRTEDAGRVALGFATGAIFAVGGQLFRESRPRPAWLAAFVAWILPIAVAALTEVRDSTWIFPFMLPVVGVLWTSVAGFTRPSRDAGREAEENRYWWFNQRALITAGLTLAGYVIILVGVLSIERAIATLFAVDLAWLFYNWVLPILGGWVAPAVWLSTIPRPDSFDAARYETPDFLSRAIAFLGQYVAAPLLLIYAAILFVYAGQIAITRQLPEGMLGWMVLCFTIAGAGVWLVLHPPFMRANPVVRFYRRWWWWLTLIPLALFAYAIYVRVAAYGLTLDRLLVILGGIWAALLALLFLIRRTDIRLIPGLGAVIIALMSFGPWNVINLPAADQAARLDRALATIGPDLDWTRDNLSVAYEAASYLYSNQGRRQLEAISLSHGFDLAAVKDYSLFTVLEHFRIGQPSDDYIFDQFGAYRTIATPVDVSSTPFLLGAINVYEGPPSTYDQFGIRPALEGEFLVIRVGGVAKAMVDLTDFAFKQKQGEIIDPWIDFGIDGRLHRFVVDAVTVAVDRRGSEEKRTVRQINGLLFAGPMPTNPPVDFTTDTEQPAMLSLPEEPAATPAPAASPSP